MIDFVVQEMPSKSGCFFCGEQSSWAMVVKSMHKDGKRFGVGYYILCAQCRTGIEKALRERVEEAH